jgi:hypothetical protein
MNDTQAGVADKVKDKHGVSNVLYLCDTIVCSRSSIDLNLVSSGICVTGHWRHGKDQPEMSKKVLPVTIPSEVMIIVKCLR